jgi:hypothetical protein
MADHKYIELWLRKRDAIVSLIEQGGGEYKFDEREFFQAGDRDPKGYSFNLEYKNVQQTNNISGSAVARDLDQVLLKTRDELRFRKAAARKHVKIRVDSEFILNVTVK